MNAPAVLVIIMEHVLTTSIVTSVIVLALSIYNIFEKTDSMTIYAYLFQNS
jgi:hypothetical protein